MHLPTTHDFSLILNGAFTAVRFGLVWLVYVAAVNARINRWGNPKTLVEKNDGVAVVRKIFFSLLSAAVLAGLACTSVYTEDDSPFEIQDRSPAEQHDLYIKTVSFLFIVFLYANFRPLKENEISRYWEEKRKD
jgi:hypothetical protein